MGRTPRKIGPAKPSIGVMNETLVVFADSSTLPGSPTPGNLQSWITSGIRSLTSKRPCYLEWCRIGGKRYTSVEAYDRFTEAINS